MFVWKVVSGEGQYHAFTVSLIHNNVSLRSCCGKYREAGGSGMFMPPLYMQCKTCLKIMDENMRIWDNIADLSDYGLGEDPEDGLDNE